MVGGLGHTGRIVSAAACLLGRSAWYAPRPLRRLHARFGLSEGGPTPGPTPSPTPDPTAGPDTEPGATTAPGGPAAASYAKSVPGA
ncbi:hypothetical protein [Streptomyces buecherae]|uniref:hypothetical protein n=1 Tax=Streptomyces buecherae TaxID=2763006 RepID=UPI0036895E92